MEDQKIRIEEIIEDNKNVKNGNYKKYDLLKILGAEDFTDYLGKFEDKYQLKEELKLIF